MESLKSASESIGEYVKDQILIQVFSGILNEEKLIKLLGEIKNVFSEVSILGATTAGEIMDGKSYENETVINITIFEYTKVKTAIRLSEDNYEEDANYLGDHILSDDLKVIIVMQTGIKSESLIDSRPLIRELIKTFPHITVAGGHAGDYGRAIRTFSFTEDCITEHGTAIAGLYGSSLTSETA